MWIMTIEETEPDRDKPCIDWLDAVIKQANEITALILIEIMHNVRYGRLAESGKATVLKTVDNG